MDKKLGK